MWAFLFSKPRIPSAPGLKSSALKTNSVPSQRVFLVRKRSVNLRSHSQACAPWMSALPHEAQHRFSCISVFSPTKRAVPRASTCMQYPTRPEEGAGFPGTIDDRTLAAKRVLRAKFRSWEVQLVLLTTELSSVSFSLGFYVAWFLVLSTLPNSSICVRWEPLLLNSHLCLTSVCLLCPTLE